MGNLGEQLTRTNEFVFSAPLMMELFFDSVTEAEAA
jgi:hypothetical protein